MKKKLYRIGNSKEPTPERMLKMADNLRSVHRGHCAVIIDADAYRNSSKIRYAVYVAGLNPGHRYSDTWPDTIMIYRKLMKETPNGS